MSEELHVPHRTPDGKVDHQPRALSDSMRLSPGHSSAEIRTALEETMAKIWAEVLNLQTVDVDDDFFELGGHSFLAAKLFARIEKVFGKKLPLATLFEYPTIAEISRLVQQLSQGADQKVLAKIHGDGVRPPLFFTPSVGGESFYGKRIASYLGDDQPVWSFQVPEEAGAASSLSGVEAMAAFFVDELTRSQMHGPYCLVGYSFGAAVAFEMAQQLWARGDRVAVLAIIDGDLSRPRPRNFFRFLSSAWASLCNLPYWLIDDFLRTPPQKMLARLAFELRTIADRLRNPLGVNLQFDPLPNDTVDPTNPAAFERRTKAAAANMDALRQYKPRSYPGRITLLRARTTGLLAAHREYDNGWGKIAAGGVDIRTIPGNHNNIVHEPFVRILARELRCCLDQVDSPPGNQIGSMPDIATVSSAPKLKSSRDLAVQELFEQQSAAAPGAVALLFEGQEFTYGEVNERANRLAHRLIGLGVTPGTFVGLCMERSVEVVVGLLAILKAGGAYVPLDPTYPDERLAFMLRDTAAPLVLAHRATHSRLATFSGQTTVLCLDTDTDSLAGETATNPTCGISGDDLAYVMYTSGSTGSPKGVLVKHRGVIRLVRDTDYCRFGPGEVFLHLAPLAFDASTFEIWGPLLNGSRLAILPPVLPTPDALAAAIQRHGVTTMWLTAALFHLVVDQRVEALAQLRQLVAGGDVLSPSHVGRALAALQDGVLINGYGPTESTTFACCYRMTKDYRPGSNIPIGRPISNTTTHVLDERLQPVPVGAVGELYIGGDGLARGYLNNDKLTAEKFIADPFSSDSAARLYRTGDRVRSLTDGNLEFLGRFDNQVKIMGHRVEPGEIEAVLWQHADVRQAVVIARTQPNGEKQLAAYVVPRNPGCSSSDDLKRHLANKLPSYMVPTSVVFLERFPLTSNGKVDRSALPAPRQSEPAETVSRAPVTKMEERLAALWGRILNRIVGLDENFFDLGVTSLQLLEFHAELITLLGRQLPVTELFEHVTVRTLAGRLAGSDNVDPTLAQARERGRRQKEALSVRKQANRAEV